MDAALIGTAIANMAFETIIVLVSWYALSRTKWYSVYDRKGKMSWQNGIVKALLFGTIGFFGVAFFNTKIGAGNLNARDLPVILAGLLGGPIAGIGAGGISAVLRWTLLSGTSHLPSTITFFTDGIVGSILWYVAGKKFPEMDLAAVTVVIAEFIHMILIWFMSTPAEAGPAFVRDVAMAVIIYETMATVICVYIYKMWMPQKEPYEEALIGGEDETVPMRHL
jgi:sigma-B regulation protein RsbU (phosphoserine phosphatase)